MGVVGTLDLGEDGIVGLDSLGLVGDDWLLDDLGCWNLDGLGDPLLDNVLIVATLPNGTPFAPYL